jgi:hypothetical protein
MLLSDSADNCINLLMKIAPHATLPRISESTYFVINILSLITYDPNHVHIRQILKKLT